jgi:hypothetical protein
VSDSFGLGETRMKGVIVVALTVLSTSAAFAETDNFDAHERGAEPEGWACHIRGPGAVGLWTKADSVTAFDDFSYGAKKE